MCISIYIYIIYIYMFHANVRTVQATPPDAVCNSIGKGISSVSSSNGLHANPRRCRPADPRKIIGFMKSAFFTYMLLCVSMSMCL